MKIIKVEEAKKYIRSPFCDVLEYETGDTDINLAVSEIFGRHPEKGFSVNTKCKEQVFVIAGKGIIFVGDKEFKISKGDSVLVEQNEKFYFDGNLKVLIACNPAWNINQYKSL
jgi:mannose-6-phosphate isomerase-like protein (cupin superfamily)